MQYPDKTLVALLGLAVGDAFGCPFEYHEGAPKYAQRSVREQRYLKGQEDCHSLPQRCRTHGLWSDDTQQTLVLLWIWGQLVDKQRDPKDPQMVGGLFLRVCRAMAQAPVPARSTSFGVHRGTGKYFREALFSDTPPDTAGLGAAMRVGPLATLLETHEILPWIQQVSAHTTSNPIAHAAAAYFAVHVHMLSQKVNFPSEDALCLSTMSPEFIVAWGEVRKAHQVLLARGEEGLLAYATSLGSADKPLTEAANGFALTGVPWVIWAAMSASSFEDALLRVCSSGGDTDTVAAMTGCLASLRFGAPAIPAWMTQGLVGVDFIRDPASWHPILSEQVHVAMDLQVMIEAEQHLAKKVKRGRRTH